MFGFFRYLMGQFEDGLEMAETYTNCLRAGAMAKEAAEIKLMALRMAEEKHQL